MTDKKDPPIPMERGFTDDDLVKVTLVNNNPKIEMEANKTDEDDTEIFLSSIMEFWNMRTDLGIHNSAPKTFSCFRQILPTAMRCEWDMIKMNLPGNTLDDFCAAVDEFIAHYMDADQDLKAQKRYLDTYQLPVKNGKMILSARRFSFRLRFLNNLMRLFPNAPADAANVRPGGLAPYTDLELKNILFNALPQALQDAYIASGRSASDDTVSLNDFAKFLDITSKAVKFKDTSTAHHPVARDGSPHRRGSARRSKKNSSKDSGKPTASGDDCPLHPGKHKWKSCYANPASSSWGRIHIHCI